jgi:hypothetical protein
MPPLPLLPQRNRPFLQSSLLSFRVTTSSPLSESSRLASSGVVAPGPALSSMGQVGHWVGATLPKGHSVGLGLAFWAQWFATTRHERGFGLGI